MIRNTRTFKDLDFNFSPHPVTGDAARKYDVEAIKQSIKSLVLTNHYERLFHPEIGSQVSAMLFENTGPLLQVLLQTAITNTIINLEPRVELKKVNVLTNEDNNTIYVTVTFKILNTTTPVNVDIILKRTR